MLKKMLLILACALLLASGCSKRHSFSIGMDPFWQSANFGTDTASINGFIHQLFQEVGKVEHASFNLFERDSQTLLNDLQESGCKGVVTSVTPDQTNQHTHLFSEPFLKTGPVLVMPVNSSETSIQALNNKIIGVYQFDNSIQLAEKNPSLIIHTYQNMPKALEDLASGKLDAVLMRTLEAHALVSKLYPGILWISSPPLTEEALRVAAPKEKGKNLINTFNQGLLKLKQSGEYAKIRASFGIY